MSATAAHVVKPGWFTVNVMNRAVAWLTRRGVSVWGSRVLAVRGRKSGAWRTTPVNVLTLDGARYLVAPRGHVQWTRNMRAVGGGELHLGKQVEAFTATEVGDDAKVEVLRAYLKRWKAEVGVFFAGVGPDSTDAELRAIAPKHPVFRIASAADDDA
ncbi:nitroreductase family deazaflavin-dependent oxidoreductase [Streptomyces filamentosus]|uniref:Nitroreductase n=1 Tax=Streptomyces filamentosus TaxID=67294 RepID=A0A919BU87_STRFL|nr:nitroreductase family deazaflavin-dependent oxidoreductase [Streptomyces filamentosus]KAA6216279.1 nitroreductase family deazaflavin-dependent oxidoreductase [Streptomyces filamentosus]GHG10966.1 nitroreductase [Streptomyces filamentosus]